jgi:hypothetical protein
MKLFGYSISLNVLILIGILYLIMVVNALSGSCNREGMSTIDTDNLARVEYIIDKAARTNSYLDKMKTTTTDPKLLSRIDVAMCKPTAATPALFNNPFYSNPAAVTPPAVVTPPTEGTPQTTLPWYNNPLYQQAAPATSPTAPTTSYSLYNNPLYQQAAPTTSSTVPASTATSAAPTTTLPWYTTNPLYKQAPASTATSSAPTTTLPWYSNPLYQRAPVAQPAVAVAQ